MMKFAPKAIALSIFCCDFDFCYGEDKRFILWRYCVRQCISSNGYRFRGVTQSSNNPAIQGGFNFSHTSGAYLALWGSSVDFGVPGVSTETDATSDLQIALL